jgi:putative pyruvate formate lyase activating enzyme
LAAQREWASRSQDAFTYNQSSVRLDDQGRVAFADLTMELVPVAAALSSDPNQRARLAEFRTDWPGGRDPLAVVAPYVAMQECGELARRIGRLKEIRERDELGVFRAGRGGLRIGGANLNVGEEREVSGTHGSGTVYFAGCNMKCGFCQYGDISQMQGGVRQTPADLAEVFLRLQARGAHNLQLMTPSHYAVEILEALELGVPRGLSLPLVYNTGGYEDVAALRELDGVISIYLPDAKFGNDAAGKRYGGVERYVAANRAAIAEMWRQVGKLSLDPRGVAVRGVLVRHLVMPNDAADACGVARSLAEVSTELDVHVMAGWQPTFRTFQALEIHRDVTAVELAAASDAFRRAGFTIPERGHEETGV